MSARRLARLAGLSTSTVHDILNNPNFKPQISSLLDCYIALGLVIDFSGGPEELDDALTFLTIRKWYNFPAGRVRDLGQLLTAFGGLEAAGSLLNNVKSIEGLEVVLNSLTTER